MTSRSSFSRRRPCQHARTALGACSEVEAAGLASGGPPVEYWLGALDEPTQLYVVFVSLRAGRELTDRALGRLYCQLQELVPTESELRDDELICQVLCTAPSAQAAAWKTVERVRELDDAVLVQVEAGLPGDAAPQVVLTSGAAWLRRRPGDDGPEGALCA
jgi:hypothetical protein